MKKFVVCLGLLFSLSLTSLATPKAEAGVLTVVNGLATLGDPNGSGFGGMVVGGLITWGGFALQKSPSSGWRVVGVVLIVLDAKDMVSKDAALAMINSNEKLSMIDDNEAKADLAALISSEVNKAGAAKANGMVSIPANQVRSILKDTSLTADQVNEVVAVLQ